MNRRLRHLALGLVACVAACGDPLADGSWRGNPLFTLDGWVHLAVSPEEYASLDWLREGELRTAIFWAPTRGSSYSLATAVEQDVSTVGSFPARFTVTIHEPPPDTLLRLTDDGAPYAVGLVVAYRDLDGDGRWNRDAERLVGGAENRFVLYAPDGMRDRVFGTLEAGFHRIAPVEACGPEGGTITYQPDATTDLVLSVGRGFPAEITLRLGCDGSGIAWQGACPPLHQVRQQCSDTEGAVRETTDPMCGACRGLLAPVLRDEVGCRRWLEGCVLRFPAEECQREVVLCLGGSTTTPPPVEPPPTCDPVCMCQREYEYCLDANPGEIEACRRRLEVCVNATRS
jgi:hypothetical protein